MGLNISGGLPFTGRFRRRGGFAARFYADLRINGWRKWLRLSTRPEGVQDHCTLEVGFVDAGPSYIPSPFSSQAVRELSPEEIEQIIACFVDAILDMRACGFDGFNSMAHMAGC